MTDFTHVVTQAPRMFTIASGKVEVHQLRAWQDNYIWVLYSPSNREAVVVDGPNAAPLLDWLNRHPCDTVSIWNTHHHHDHVGINQELLKRENDFELSVVGSASRAEDIPGLTRPVDEGDRVHFSGLAFEVWRTEGHVDGHLCFVHPELLFCGDTLFAGGCGYLFDGPPKKMYDSLARLASLPPTTHVCCAHEYTLDNLRFAHFIEPDNLEVRERLNEIEVRAANGITSLPSTIGLERRTNPFLRANEPAFVKHLAAYASEPLNAGADTFALVRRLKDQKVHKRA